jgi:ABC-type Zn2+ transport system substrate-binding protein/surface adhesin
MTIGAKFNGINIGLALLLALSVMIAPLSAVAEQQAESFDGSVYHYSDHEEDHELDRVEDKSGDQHDKFHAHSCGTCHIHVYAQTAMVDISARSPASLLLPTHHLDLPSTGSGGLFRPPRA